MIYCWPSPLNSLPLLFRLRFYPTLKMFIPLTSLTSNFSRPWFYLFSVHIPLLLHKRLDFFFFCLHPWFRLLVFFSNYKFGKLTHFSSSLKRRKHNERYLKSIDKYWGVLFVIGDCGVDLGMTGCVFMMLRNSMEFRYEKICFLSHFFGFFDE